MLYVDPGAGSIVLQVMAVAVLGGLFVAKRWWSSVTQRFRASVQRLRGWR